MGSYVNWYNSQNYDKLTVVVPKGTTENIRKEALKQGLSVGEFIRRLIPKHLIAERVYKGRKNKNDDYSGIRSGKP